MRYYVKKIVSLIMVLFLIMLLTFIAFQVIPGDGAISRLGVDATDEEVEALREALGLNRSLPKRFFSFLGGAVHGDFGKSYQYSKPVSELLTARLPATVGLAAISIILILVISVPLGLLCSRKEGGAADRAVTILTQTLMAVPAFFLGIIITLVFGLILLTFQIWGKEIKHINYVIFLYSLFIMYYDCIQIRNTIAVFLILIALYLSAFDRKILGIIFCIIAVFFHRFAILMGMIVLYTVIIKPNKKYKIQRNEILFITIAGCAISILGMPIILFVSEKISLVARLKFYISSTLSIDSFIIWAGPAIVYLIIMWYLGIRKINKEDSGISIQKRKLINILFRYSLFSVATSGFLLYLNEFNRLYRMFYLVLFLLFGIIETELSRKNRWLLFCMMSAVNIVFMGVAMLRGINFDLFW